ncbi:hypothetical protein DENIS_2834 [Desulfonema ishimotonii]|uniref:DUF2786 domain-containing protein n=1 Tax=Desulfonema ishimotonii TaxID=45657 RepID=A0A401FXY8_9BACT|nr:DUF2786 domain-containing protein [Desulfonema ishimotonii]GBC61872.1 hypothetical protein DENIS_2834 [Desulfonema ishimotonii]
MKKRKNSEKALHAELERRILHGLACEWEMACRILKPAHQKYMKSPLFRLREMKYSLGKWFPVKREIALSRDFVLHHSWDSVVEVLLHEMAHQFAHEVLNGRHEKPHGPSFQEACRQLRANPKASGSYPPLSDRLCQTDQNTEDRILIRVRKLMALAESQNRHEAEAAMSKAHVLIAKHNIDLITHSRERVFISAFIGVPALRRFREEYALAHLLQDFYFVRGIWVSAYVMEKGKMGRVLEISGTARNVRMAGYVYDFVRHFTDMQWDAYTRSTPLSRYRKSDFAIGILEGFRSKLESPDDAGGEDTGTREMVRVEDPLLTGYMAYRYPHTRSIRRGAATQDGAVHSDGVRVGKKLVIAQGITETGKGGPRLIGSD